MNNEDKVLEFQSPIPESVNHYLSQRVVKKGKNFLVMNYPSKGNVEYKNIFKPYIEQLVKDSGWDKELTRGKHYYLDAVIYFDRTDKDEQNYWKMPCDIMNDIVYIDDSMILTRCLRIFYTYNKDIPPHIEYKLVPVDYIGIWNSTNDYKSFIDKCKLCRNYKDGKCGRLSDYLSYKITNDYNVKTGECLGYKEIKAKKR